MTNARPPRLHAGLALDAVRVEPPPAHRHALPERVLLFGTGAFLRGFALALLDEALREEAPSAGRAVAVASTGGGRAAALAAQDGLYTLCTRGLREGEPVDACRVVGSLARALPAASRWDEVLRLAVSPDLALVVSNTTEVGLATDPHDRLDASPPASFPAKLAAVLVRRAEALGHAPEAGLVILPCELVEDNGARLRELVLATARRAGVPARTLAWIAEANRFATTLVDRIVAEPDSATRAALAHRLGYEDALLTVTEPFRLWAIEDDGALARRLPWLAAREGVVLTPDVRAFRERKVRLLNGAHSLLVPVGLLAGHTTVAEAVTDATLGAWLRGLLHEELAPTLDGPPEEAHVFARSVLERFRNPFLPHALAGIALQQTSKVGVRVLPALHDHVRRFGTVPPRLAFGLGALAVLEARAAAEALPPDDAAPRWRALAAAHPEPAALARAAVRDPVLWDPPPGALPGVPEAVAAYADAIARRGVRAALRDLLEPAEARHA